MTELDIKKAITEGLIEVFGNRFAIRDYPLDVSTYKPIHAQGELLIKSLGFRPIQYINPDGETSIFTISNFVVNQHQFVVTLLVRESWIRLQDTILELSEEIIETMLGLYLEPDDISEARGFLLTDANEPDYDAEIKCHVRILTFSLPVFKRME